MFEFNVPFSRENGMHGFIKPPCNITFQIWVSMIPAKSNGMEARKLKIFLPSFGPLKIHCFIAWLPILILNILAWASCVPDLSVHQAANEGGVCRSRPSRVWLGRPNSTQKLNFREIHYTLILYLLFCITVVTLESMFFQTVHYGINEHSGQKWKCKQELPAKITPILGWKFKNLSFYRGNSQASLGVAYSCKMLPLSWKNAKITWT